MAFQIGLVHKVDAVFIAQVIPRRLVGIVAGADGIDIVFADSSHGVLHFLNANDPSGFRIPLMTIDAPNHQPLTVKSHQPILYFKPAEADPIRDPLYCRPPRILHRQNDLIQFRRLIAPRKDILKFQHLRH